MWQTDKEPAIYFLASRANGTLYIGVTSDLYERIRQHKAGTFSGFTSKYGVKTLVCYECFDFMDEAITRESRLKKWKRLWKIRLIEEMNPMWMDLFNEANGIRKIGIGGQKPSLRLG